MKHHLQPIKRGRGFRVWMVVCVRILEQSKEPCDLKKRVIAPFYRGGLLMVLLQIVRLQSRAKAAACQLPALTGLA